MGIYPSQCIVCKKGFLWFSGNPIQICGKCEMENEVKTEEFVSKKHHEEVVEKLRSALVKCRNQLHENHEWHQNYNNDRGEYDDGHMQSGMCSDNISALEVADEVLK